MAETSTTVVNLGSINRIPEGQARCYVVGAEEIAIFRQRDGQIFATANRCPHRQGPLSEGVFGGEHVICPLHGHRFNLEAGTGDDAGESLKVFAVKIKEGDIILTV